MFTQNELQYIRSQRLARIGTVDDNDQVDVSPVIFEFDGQHFFIGGIKNATTRKYKNVLNGHAKLALALDDIVSVSPWVVRGMKIFGLGEIVDRISPFFKGAQIKITPTVHWSWGIEEDIMIDGKSNVHRVIW